MNIGLISLATIGLFRKLFHKKDKEIKKYPYTGVLPNVVELDSLPPLEVPPGTFCNKLYTNDIPSVNFHETAEPSIDSIVYYNMTVKELRHVAKSKNIKNYFSLKKHELIDIILNN